jgi:hypothetical protein
MLLSAIVKSMKKMAINANIPSDERKIATFKPRFLNVKMKTAVTDNRAPKAKSAEKGN